MKLSNHFGLPSLVAFSMLGMGQLAYSQDYPSHLFTASIGGGYTAITGDSSGRLDRRGNIQASAGINMGHHFGINGTFTFNQVGITRSALDLEGQADGNGGSIASR